MAEIISIQDMMKLDRGKLMEKPTAVVKAAHLSKLLQKDVYVKLQALPGDSFTELMGMAANKEGNVAFDRLRGANAMVVVEGMVEPSLKDKDLQEHFGAATPKDLAGLLFPGGELNLISQKIGELSGFSDKMELEEVKN